MSVNESILEHLIPETAARVPPEGARDEIVDCIRALEAAARSLDPGAGERRRLHGAVHALVERFLSDLDTLPAFGRDDRGVLETAITDTGIPIESAAGILDRDVLRIGGSPASPRHLAYITGGGVYHAALGDFLAAASNKFAGLMEIGRAHV